MAGKRNIVVLLVVLILALTACGQTTPPAAPTSESAAAPATAAPAEAPPETEAETTEAEAEAETTEAEPAESAEAITIDFWIPAGRGRDEGAAAVVEAFEAEHPNIQVEINSIPFGEFFNALQVAYAGDNPPDAALTNGTEVQYLAYNGALLPITDIFTEEDMNDFMPDLIDMVSLDGEMYGAPIATAANAMYYNIDYFEAAGVEVPQTLDEAWTWPEFVENVNKVREHQAEQGNEIWGMVGLDNPILQTFFGWTIIRSNSEPGSPLWESISPDLTTVAGYIDTDEAMEAYEFYQSLYTDGFSPKDAVPDAFGTGQAATFFAIPPSGNEMDRNFPDLNWGIMPVPYLKTPLAHTGSFAPTVSAKTDNVEAAKEFVQFFASPEGYRLYQEIVGDLPGRRSMQETLPELQEGYLAFLFNEAQEWGESRPGGPAHAIFNSIVAGEMLRNIALGGDIEAEVAAAIQKADAQLAQFE